MTAESFLHDGCRTQESEEGDFRELLDPVDDLGGSLAGDAQLDVGLLPEREQGFDAALPIQPATVKQAYLAVLEWRRRRLRPVVARQVPDHDDLVTAPRR